MIQGTEVTDLNFFRKSAVKGKLAFYYSVKRPVSTPFIHSSRSILAFSSKQCSLSMLRKFNPFLTIIGTVRFLICLGIRLHLNQWRVHTIKAC